MDERYDVLAFLSRVLCAKVVAATSSEGFLADCFISLTLWWASSVLTLLNS